MNTTRNLTAAFCSILLASSLCSAQATASSHPLKESFARGAFRALKLIEIDANPALTHQRDTFTASKEPSEAMIDLEFDAQSPDERAVLIMLNNVLNNRIYINQSISRMFELTRAKLHAPDLDSAYVAGHVVKQPATIQATRLENACFYRFEEMLKSKDFHMVPECATDKLRVRFPVADDEIILPK